MIMHLLYQPSSLSDTLLIVRSSHASYCLHFVCAFILGSWKHWQCQNCRRRCRLEPQQRSMDLGLECLLHLLRPLRMDYSTLETSSGTHLRGMSLRVVGSLCHVLWCCSQYGWSHRKQGILGYFRSEFWRWSVSHPLPLSLDHCSTKPCYRPYFLSLFYQRRELAFRVSLLLGMSPLANCFAGALAYGITHIRNSIEPWRLLFLIEGAPTILFAPVVFFFLPDSPGQAKFLDEAQQTQAVERLQTRDHTAKSKIHWKQFFAGLLDYRNVIHTCIHFMCNYSFAGLSNFLPTIVQGLGYSSINAQGLTAPIYFCAFLLCVVAAMLSDKYGKRGFLICGFSAMGTIGYLLLASIEDPHRSGARYCGAWLAACGIFPCICLNVSISPSHTSTSLSPHFIHHFRNSSSSIPFPPCQTLVPKAQTPNPHTPPQPINQPSNRLTPPSLNR